MIGAHQQCNDSVQTLLNWNTCSMDVSVNTTVKLFKGLIKEVQSCFTAAIAQRNVCTEADEKSYDGLAPLSSCDHKGSIATWY